jgi:hypothetical protein
MAINKETRPVDNMNLIPHDGYVIMMSTFAKNLADDLGIPLKITVYAPPKEKGLGLLRIERGSKNMLDTEKLRVSDSSSEGQEAVAIMAEHIGLMVRQNLRLPIVFLYEKSVCFAGAEMNWVKRYIPDVQHAVAQCFIGLYGRN